MTALLDLTGLGKRYGTVDALHDVGMTVAAGTVHCVLGENGAGKSTLCNLVGGGIRPSTGEMTLRGTAYSPGSPADALSRGVAMVHQHFSLVPTMTVRENLLLSGRGLRPDVQTLRARLDRIADEFGLRVDDARARVAELPVGARQKVEIVKALLPDPDLVLLDEPTAVLDGAEIDALIGTCQAVAASGRAVVLVTHKLGEVSRVADTATVLRDGTVAGSGRLSEVSVGQLLSLMLGRDTDAAGGPTVLDPVAAAGVGLAARRPIRDRVEVGPTAMTARGLTVTRPDGNRVLDGAGLDLRAGEITGIAGVEGNGQTELVRVLSGALRPDAGEVHIGDHPITTAPPARRTALGLGVVPEDRHHEAMVGDMSIAENLYLADLGRFRRHGFLRRGALDQAAAGVIREFAVRAPGPRTPMRALSGGNQQKVVLARELAVDGLKVLVAAQPTRGLDVGAVGQVLTRLREAADRGIAVLVVSSEVAELLALCDRILVGYRGRLLGPVDATAPTAAAEIGALMAGTTA